MSGLSSPETIRLAKAIDGARVTFSVYPVAAVKAGPICRLITCSIVPARATFRTFDCWAWRPPAGINAPSSPHSKAMLRGVIASSSRLRCFLLIKENRRFDGGPTDLYGSRRTRQCIACIHHRPDDDNLKADTAYGPTLKEGPALTIGASLIAADLPAELDTRRCH